MMKYTNWGSDTVNWCGWTRFISGKVIGGYIDGRVLGPLPLGMTEVGVWDPHYEWADTLRDIESGPVPDYMRIILAEGCRTAYEMEQIIPGFDYEDRNDDPITIAAEYGRAGYYKEAFAILHECLKGDLCCVDAFAHLGLYRMRSAMFDEDVRIAVKCYRAGVAVGEQAFPASFDGVFGAGLTIAPSSALSMA